MWLSTGSALGPSTIISIYTGGSVVKNLSANAGDTVLIPGSGRSPGEGKGYPLQYSCLGNPMVGYSPWGHKKVRHNLGTTQQQNTHHIFFIHSSVDGHLGYFHILAPINNAAMNTELQVHVSVLVFFRYIPRSAIVGSYCSSTCSILRNLHTVTVPSKSHCQMTRTSIYLNSQTQIIVLSGFHKAKQHRKRKNCFLLYLILRLRVFKYSNQKFAILYADAVKSKWLS